MTAVPEYRTFRIVYAILTLQFIIPAISYAVAPEMAIDTLDRVNRILGGGPYLVRESGHLWHMLAVGNVMTLGWMCGLLFFDLRRFYPIVPALAFLKGFSALFALAIGVRRALPTFTAIFVLDAVTTVAIVAFAVRAHRALRGEPRFPLWSWLLLFRPDRISASLQRIRAAGLVERAPTLWQIWLGVLRLWRRLIFRSGTIGTSRSRPVRRTWRARLLRFRLLRFPFLLTERAIAPLDFSGLSSPPDRVLRHLLGAHHDGAQFLYDLELLSTVPGKLEELRAAARAVVDGSSPRAEWLRDLAVFEGYHEELLLAVERMLAGQRWPAPVETDPDLSLRAHLRWCAQQAPSPGETLRGAFVPGRRAS